MPRVIIADDHALVREGLRKVLAAEPDMQVVGEAAHFPGLVALVEATPADVVLTDLNMPGAGGALKAIKQMRDFRLGLPIIVLSVIPESQGGLEVLIAGASGYVSKAVAAQEVVTAIRKVVRGYRYISPALRERLLSSEPPREDDGLSAREHQVLCLIALGFTVKEIASQLDLSVSTVHTHRARVLHKLQLRSDVELSHYALQKHLVEWRWR
jgi:two-component system, NarL family, invasion response regulator UvrY